jgi:hypothetical protein
MIAALSRPQKESRHRGAGHSKGVGPGLGFGQKKSGLDEAAWYQPFSRQSYLGGGVAVSVLAPFLLFLALFFP